MRKQVEVFYSEHFLCLDFFTLVPESSYSVRISESTPQGPSDSTRDNLEHLIVNLEDRLKGIQKGEYKWSQPDLRLKQLSKADLLQRLINADSRLLQLVFEPNIRKTISTQRGSLSTIEFIGNMIPHQIYHQGIHIGLMDRLNMKRPNSYVARWGP